MDIKVKCIDPLFSARGDFSLKKGQSYTVKRITARLRSTRREDIINLYFELNEIPSADYLARRFKIIGKINIIFPDDIYNFPIV